MSKKCQKCGTEMADDMNFCPKCHSKYTLESKTEIADVPPAVSQEDKGKVRPWIIHTINGVLGLINFIVYLVARFELLNDCRLLVLGGTIIFAIQIFIFVFGQSIILSKQSLSVKLTTWAICAVSGLFSCLSFCLICG
ncbi:MAG: zinc ribbon domain-containing protein [Lentisphaeria bacterium]|nr:zinc ribbon domain-containing protein [Lentisphaeria bacterium]